MPFFILVGKVVHLDRIKSDLIMLFPAQTINNMPLNPLQIIVICNHAQFITGSFLNGQK